MTLNKCTMNMKCARALVEDAFYQRLCRDLERRKRKRKIGQTRYEAVLAVSRLPRTVPNGAPEMIPQWMLDRAHSMASLIRSSLHGPWLEYDYNPQIVVLHGSYGSRG